MPATVTVLYPARDDATFNMDYYVCLHLDDEAEAPDGLTVQPDEYPHASGHEEVGVIWPARLEV